jgi:RND family efflux transporter MFP subunit
MNRSIVHTGLGSILALSFLSLSMLAGCEDNQYQPPPPPAVTVSTPSQRDVVEYKVLTGTTSALSVVEVRARVQGILKEKSLTPGAMVEEGDLLFVIDDEPFVAHRDAALATVASAEAKMRLAETTADRTERAVKNGGVSELVALEERARADQARAEYEIALRELAIKQLDVDYATITAPIRGRVVKSPMDIGQLVGQSGDASLLTTVYDDSKIFVNFTVPDRVYLSAIRRLGADPEPPSVDIGTEADDGFPFVGVIDYIDPSVDPTTGTIGVRAIIDNPDRQLLPGLFVKIRVAVGETQGALLVPRTSISRDQAGAFVYVVNEGNIVERRNVALGSIDGEEQVVLSGIDASDRVIVVGILRARPGAPVTPAAAEPQTTNEN